MADSPDFTDDQLRNVARAIAGRDPSDEEADAVLLDLAKPQEEHDADRT